MEIERMFRPESSVSSVSERLRWTSDFLALANKAIGIVACAHGIDCPPDLHQTLRRDLQTWAWYLEGHPLLAAELEQARVANGESVVGR
jgi:hypothetical protein